MTPSTTPSTTLPTAPSTTLPARHTGSDVGLAALLRNGSRQEHREAEGQPFVVDLLAGRITAADLLAFLTRLLPVYDRLETVGELLAEDPLAAAVVDPALHRAQALREDLAFWWRLAGNDPDALDEEEAVGSTLEQSPATAAYVDRVAATAAWGGLYVAHHYTRYLGDLSGGQAMVQVLSRTFDLRDGHGVRFFAFPQIARVKPYKDRYRARLDALAVGEAGRRRMLEEVKVAFALNQAVLADLRPERTRCHQGAR